MAGFPLFRNVQSNTLRIVPSKLQIISPAPDYVVLDPAAEEIVSALNSLVYWTSENSGGGGGGGSAAVNTAGGIGGIQFYNGTTFGANTNLRFDASTLTVNGQAVFTANLTVNNGVLFVDTITNRVGLNDTIPNHTLSVNGTAYFSNTVNVLGTLEVTDTINALSAIKVSGTINALGALEVVGAINALGTLGVTGEINALSTLNVSGTLNAIGDVRVAGNAEFDTDTLFVDATNHRVGINTTTPGAGYALDVAGVIRADSFVGSGALDPSGFANGTIEYVKLQNGTAGQLLMINATGNVQSIALTGDATISPTGVLRLGTDGVLTVNALIANTLTVSNTFQANGAINALSTLRVNGSFIALNTSSLTGTVNVLSTLGVGGAVNALSTLGVSGTLNALGAMNVLGSAKAFSTVEILGVLTARSDVNVDSGTLFVDSAGDFVGLGNTSPAHRLRVEGTTSLNGAVNALSTLSVTGAVNALSTLGVNQATNLFSTLGVTGKITGFGQLEILANAIFDTDTLYVDAVNHRVGIGNTNPGSPNKLVVTGRTLLQSSTEIPLRVARTSTNYLDVSVNALGHATLNVRNGGLLTTRLGIDSDLMLVQDKRLYLEGVTDTSIRGISATPSIIFQTGGQDTLKVQSDTSIINSAIASPDAQSQISGWQISRAGSADFRYIFANEMHVKNFIADLEQALAGGQIISKSVAVLYENFIVPAYGGSTTLKVEDLPSAPNSAVFEVNDYVMLRTFTRGNGQLSVGECVGTVSGYNGNKIGADNVRFQEWNFTRATGNDGGLAATAATIYKGALVLDFGVSNNGYHEVNAFDGVYAENAPYSQIVTWTGSPATAAGTQKVRTRLGNLKGLAGVGVAGEYGLFAGDKPTNQYFRASNKGFDLYGIDLRLFSSSTTAAIVLGRGTGNTNPYLAIGNAAPTSFTSGTGIWMGRDDSVGADIESAYRFRAGNPSGVRLTWNGSAVLLGSSSDESLVANSQGLYFFNGAETLGYLNNSQWLLGNTSSNHLTINPTGVILKTGTTEYGQFAADTRLGATSANHLLVNAIALMFRDKDSANLATMTATAIEIGTSSTSRAVINASGVTLFKTSTDYAQFAENTRVGTSSGPRVSINATGVLIYRDATNAGVILYGNGAGSLATGNISWDASGNFRVTGNINATSGLIGGWSVNSLALVKDTGTAATSAGLSPLDYPFYAGATYENRPYAPFRVTPSGSLIATSGTVGGWVLDAEKLTGGNIILNASGDVNVGTGANIARLSSSNADWRFWVGNNTPIDAPFRVAANGELTALRVKQLSGGPGGIIFDPNSPITFGSSVNVLSTLGVSGNVNALANLGVSNIFTALGGSVLTGAANALNTFSVSGTLTAFGQLVVTTNATFDGGTLFVDAVNNRVGVGTTTLKTRAQVGPHVSNDASYSYDTDAFYAIHQTPTSASALRDPKEVLVLARQGTTNESHGAAASFKLSRYENVSTNSRSRLDLVLAHGAFLTENTTVLTALSSGRVGIGTTQPNALFSVSDGTYEGIIQPRSSASGTGLGIGTDVAAYGTNTILNLAGDLQNGGTGGGVNIGMYSSSAWRRALSVRNGGHLLLMPDGFGNVGVGNTAPTHLLRVQGTASINGAFTTDTTASFGGATNALTTFGVSGATNALGTLGVSGVFTALGTSVLTGVSNALNTFGVSGTLTALGQLVVGANATFDTNTLFVDAINDRVGIGLTNPSEVLQIQKSQDNAFTWINVTNPSTLATTATGAGLRSIQGLVGTELATTNASFGRVGTYTLNTPFYIQESGTRRLGFNAGHIGVASGTRLYFDSLTASGETYIHEIPNDNLAVVTNSVEALRITSGGNLGVGNTNPSQRLRVDGTTSLNGAVNALSTFGVTDAANALSTLGVSGTLTALGQLVVVANATFDTDTFFVDAVNNRVGVGTTTLSTRAQVGTRVSNDASYSYDTDALYVVHQTPTSATTLNDAKEVLLLARQGTTNQSTGAAASFRLSRYENVGTNSRSRLDLVLGHGAFLTSPTTVLTALSSGRVGIGTSTPNATLSVSDGTYEGIIQPRSSASGTGLGIGTDVAAYGTNTILNLAGDLQNGGTGGGVNIGMYSSSAWRRALSIRNGGNLLLMPDGFGNVGVGNATPTHLLRVQGTASINGAFTTDTTASFGGATNALTTFGVSGNANALSLLGVGGEFTALSTSKLVGASNALNTLGVSGTLTALGQLIVIANATFDTNTLFVDAVNDRVGIGNNTPAAPNKLVVDGRTLLRSDTETVQLQIAKNASTYLDVSVNTAGHAYLNMTSDVGSAARVGFAEHIMLDQNKRIYLEGATSTSIRGVDATSSINFTTGNEETLKIASPQSTINSALVSGPSIQYASRTTGWGIDRQGGADFRYIYADEMHVKNFIADLEQALAGGQIISKSVAVLYENFTAPANGIAATLKVEYLPGAPGMQVFQANDYVVLRSFSRANGELLVGDCVGKVTNPNTSNLSFQTWTFTRAATGSAGSLPSGNVVFANSLVLDYGISGSGYYEVTAVDGYYAQNAPYSQIVTWENAPVSTNRTVRARLGNLRGLTSTEGEYGLIAGSYGGNQYFRASNKAFDLYGIDLQLFSSSTTAAIVLKRGASNTNPYLAIGNAAPTSFTSGVGVWMGRDDTVGSDIESAYRFRVGNPSGDRLSWNGSAVLIGNPTSSHLVANNGVLTFRVSSETHASLSGSEWVLGRTGTNHLVINATGISLNNAGTQYAQFAADTRLGVQSDNHLALNSSAILFRAPSGTANLVVINSTSVTVGSNTDFHVRVTNTAVTLNQGTTEYGQFAGNTRLGTTAANHLLVNSSALMFRDSTSANLATMNTTAIVLGPNTSDHIYIDTTGVSLREFVGASTVEYAKFAANTSLGVNTANYLLLNSTAIMFRTSDSVNKNLVTMNASTLVVGRTDEFHTVITNTGITLKSVDTDYAQFATNTRIGVITSNHLVLNDTALMFRDGTTANLATMNSSALVLGNTSTARVVVNTTGVTLFSTTTEYAQFAVTTRLGATSSSHLVLNTSALVLRDSGQNDLATLNSSSLVLGRTTTAQAVMNVSGVTLFKGSTDYAQFAENTRLGAKTTNYNHLLLNSIAIMFRTSADANLATMNSTTVVLGAGGVTGSQAVINTTGVTLISGETDYAQFAGNTRLGATTTNHLIINSSGLVFRDALSQAVATMNALAVVIGKTATSRAEMDATGVFLYKSSTNYAQFAETTRLGATGGNHLVLNASAIEFRDSASAVLASMNVSAVVVGKTATSRAEMDANGVGLYAGAVNYAQFAGNTRLGSVSTTHLSLNNQSIVFRSSALVDLVTINTAAIILGEQLAKHIYIDTTGVSLRDYVGASTVEYAKFAANTRLGQTTANHLLLNSSAFVFRTSDSVNKNLVSITENAVTVGRIDDFHTVVNAVGITLKSSTSEYGQFAATTRIGTPTGPRVEIKTDSVKIYKADSGAPAAGVVLNSDGSGSLATGNIAWDTSGNFTMTGNVTATAGSIGGWTVNSSAIVRDTGTGATSAGLVPSEYPFYAGATYANRGLAPFRVTPDGRVVATNLGHEGGQISGLTITGSLTMDAGAVIKSGATDFTTGSGYWLQRTSGNETKLRIGNPSGDKLEWDNTKLEIKSNQLTINSTAMFLPIKTDLFNIDQQYAYGFANTSFNTKLGMYGFEGSDGRIAIGTYRAIRQEAQRTSTALQNDDYLWSSVYAERNFPQFGVTAMAEVAASAGLNAANVATSAVVFRTGTPAGYGKGDIRLEGGLRILTAAYGINTTPNVTNVEALRIYINDQPYQIFMRAGH